MPKPEPWEVAAAAAKLGKVAARLLATPPVDDDFPGIKSHYDVELHAFINTLRAARLIRSDA